MSAILRPSFLFRVVSHTPIHVRVRVSSSRGEQYAHNGILTFTWDEWRAFAAWHGWEEDISKLAALVVGGELGKNGNEQG